MFGHIAMAIFLTPVRLDPSCRGTLQNQVETALYGLVDTCKGSISAEHCLGELKRDLIELYEPPVERELMRAVKQRFDPANLMTPGKAIRLP